MNLTLGSVVPLAMFLSFRLSHCLYFCLSMVVHLSSWEFVLVVLESFCAFLGDGEQQVADGIGWMDGWDGHHG